MNNAEGVTILLVEDDPGHALLIQKHLHRANIMNNILVFNDGQRVLDYLFGEGEYAQQSQHPSSPIILLDLNLPGLDGYQVLQQLKANDRTRYIPVMILTSTDDPREVTRCYELGCNLYVTKPVPYEQFSEAIHKLGMFLSIVVVPGGL